MYIWIKRSFAILCLLAFCLISMPVTALELPQGLAQESGDQTESGIHLDSAPPLNGEDLPVGNTGTGGNALESTSNGDPQREEPDAPEKAQPESYTVTLDTQIIGDGETLSYTTVSSSYAGSIVPEGYYPGELTVELTGEIVVEAGGKLDIGTLSVGGTEASPVLTGTGRIVVRAGGQLRLTCVALEPQGQGPMIIQETGGSVELTSTPVTEGLVQWAAPLVNNLYDAPDDVWLEIGTILSGDMLPDSMKTDVQMQGHEERVDVPLAWDLSGYDGRTDGEVALAGKFLDEAGQPLTSMLPLEITVRWYTPGTLVVTEAEWKGGTVPTVQLTVPDLPEDANVWGEVSADGGETWSRWEDEAFFFIVDIEAEGKACVFVVSDDMEGLFRVVAEDPWAEEYTCWRSDAFFLSPPEDGEDSGGNRGGSTTLGSPDRQPEPIPRPDETDEPEETKPDDTQPEEDDLDSELPEGDQPDETTSDPDVPWYPEWLLPFLPWLSSDQEQTPSEGEDLTQDVQQSQESTDQENAAHPEHLIGDETKEPIFSQQSPETWPASVGEEISESNPEEDSGDEETTAFSPAQNPGTDVVGGQAESSSAVSQALSLPVQIAVGAGGFAACIIGAAVMIKIARKKK